MNGAFFWYSGYIHTAVLLSLLLFFLFFLFFFFSLLFLVTGAIFCASVLEKNLEQHTTTVILYLVAIVFSNSVCKAM